MAKLGKSAWGGEVGHPNVLGLHGVLTVNDSKTTIFLVLETANGGSFSIG